MNLPRPLVLFLAFCGGGAIFAMPLLIGADGQGLSKRLGSLSIGQLRDEGLEPMAINAYLARIGTGDADVIGAGVRALGGISD